MKFWMGFILVCVSGCGLLKVNGKPVGGTEVSQKNENATQTDAKNKKGVNIIGRKGLDLSAIPSIDPDQGTPMEIVGKEALHLDIDRAGFSSRFKVDSFHYFQTHPDAFLTLTGETDLNLSFHSGDNYSIYIKGPLTGDIDKDPGYLYENRQVFSPSNIIKKQRGQIKRVNRVSLAKRKPGRYAVFVGVSTTQKSKTGEVKGTLVFDKTKSPNYKTLQGVDGFKGVNEPSIYEYFTGDTDGAKIQAKAFVDSPNSIFVFYLNEPLLILRDLKGQKHETLSANGNIFELDRKSLTSAPTGKVIFPEPPKIVPITAASTRTLLYEMTERKTKEDKARLVIVNKMADRIAKCEKPIVIKYEAKKSKAYDQIKAVEAQPYSKSGENRIVSLRSQIDALIDTERMLLHKKCAYLGKKYDKIIEGEFSRRAKLRKKQYDLNLKSLRTKFK